MKTAIIRSLAIVGLSLLDTTASAGPFGIEMGQPLAELEPKESGAKVFIQKVPKPHPSFEHYAVWASDETGVCLGVALTKLYKNDRYGIDVRRDFDKFMAALENRYDPGKKVDFKRSWGLWKDAEDWIMAIKQNERVYGATWVKPRTDGEDNSISHIEMNITATRSDTAMIKLQYQFKNFEQCNSSIESEANDSF